MTVMQIILKQYFRFYFLILSSQGQNYLTMHTLPHWKMLNKTYTEERFNRTLFISLFVTSQHSHIWICRTQKKWSLSYKDVTFIDDVTIKKINQSRLTIHKFGILNGQENHLKKRKDTFTRKTVPVEKNSCCQFFRKAKQVFYYY